MRTKALESAHALLNKSQIFFEDKPVGMTAANDINSLAAENYSECFVRDFFPCALVSLNEGKSEIVKNFLASLLQLRAQQKNNCNHKIQSGVMPASFKKTVDPQGKESLLADFGERAIGKVSPVDSMLWWTILLGIYKTKTDDHGFIENPEIQNGIRDVLNIFLKESFEVSPTLLVPDGSFMIDRRMGVYGHPIEIQTLFFGALETATKLLIPSPENQDILKSAIYRKNALHSYVRQFYWLDHKRLKEIQQFDTEEFGEGSTNMFNIYPESIPHWLEQWLPHKAGYFVGNLGPGRIDFRFFAQGNLLAILFGLAKDEQAEKIMALYDDRWPDLIGSMPAKICYPAVEGEHWKIATGSDPKNTPWSYHNGGNWPVLLWPLVAAALKIDRRDLAEKAFNIACTKLYEDEWPEYYDGTKGSTIGKRANLNQTWSAAALVLSNQILEDDSIQCMFPHASA
ncbi:MAG: glycoside hydrolase 100 family protein [Nitrospinales bacterium]